jgi:outer membrane protein OmpA-like peptidoglycan-associated protein
MRQTLQAVILVALLAALPLPSFSEINKEKEHDYIPRFHNIIFLMDVSDSMMAGHPINYDHSRLFVAKRAMMLFNRVMPHVPRWQYDLNAAVITFGDKAEPRLLSVLSPWERAKFATYNPLYPNIRKRGFYPFRTAALQDALQLAGSLICNASGRTAIVVFTDGGSVGECPQKTAIALKNKYGKRVVIYGIFVGNKEVGWRNLYETCRLTGGYAREWEEVRSCPLMKEVAWDITVREIMFPYPEIFFQSKSADLLSSEAIKLESVANFMHAIPQYVLQIDGHTTFFGTPADNYQLGMRRARNVKDALVKMYNVDPRRIRIRSWGEELPRYDNQNPEVRQMNREANLYLMLPLRNFPYDEKRLHTFGVKAVGDIYNTQERNGDKEWAWPSRIPGQPLPPMKRGR